jgi:hypothetical protein
MMHFFNKAPAVANWAPPFTQKFFVQWQQTSPTTALQLAFQRISPFALSVMRRHYALQVHFIAWH